MFTIAIRYLAKKPKPKMKPIELKTPLEQTQTIPRAIFDILKEHGPLTIADTWEHVKGTAVGGTIEIVVNGSTGLLHPVGKEGVTPLAKNIVKLATHFERRLTMGKKGYERVKERFMEQHMAHRIASVLKEVLQKANSHSRSLLAISPH